jgi:hypothetical protein
MQIHAAGIQPEGHQNPAIVVGFFTGDQGQKRNAAEVSQSGVIQAQHVGRREPAVNHLVSFGFSHKVGFMKWILPLTIGTSCCALTFIAGMVTADLNRPAATPDTSYAEAVQASQQATITRLETALAKAQATTPHDPSADRALQSALAERDAARLAADTIEKNEARLITENVQLRQTMADERAITAQWVAFAKTQTDAAESWKVAYQSRTPATAYTPPAYTPAPRSTTLDTLAQERRRREEDYARFNGPSKQPTQIIQTGYGTATIINPDGMTSFYQSTGEGTGLITTPGP